MQSLAIVHRRLSSASFTCTCCIFHSERKTFWALLRDQGVRFTTNYNPVPCSLCDEGPVIKRALELIVGQRAKVALQIKAAATANNQTLVLSLQQEDLELISEQRKLKAKDEACRVHQDQLEKARPAVKAAEALICPGKMVMYRDFVNQHNSEGAKVNALVLVFFYKDYNAEGQVPVGPPNKLVLHNICSDPDSQGCDAWYVRDVMEHHLSGRSRAGNDLFARQKKYASDKGEHLEILQAGDHGPHFSANRTFYNQTTFMDTYQIAIHDSFLCSYHCFNVCDAAGRVSKMLSAAEARDGRGPKNSFDYVMMINTSDHANAQAFDFTKINRSAGLFPAKFQELNTATRKLCDVVYWCPAPDDSLKRVFTPGVLRARLVPGQGDYSVHDLLTRPKEWGKMCQSCSDKVQRPVYHKRDFTTCAVEFSQPPSRENIVQPQADRLTGQQQGKAFKVHAKKAAGAFPCRVLDANGVACVRQDYTQPGHANRHMAKVHSLGPTDERLYQKTKDNSSIANKQVPPKQPIAKQRSVLFCVFL